MSGVVIGVGAAVGAVIGGGSSLYGISKANRNQIKAFKQQMKYLQLNYNYNQASLDRQEKSLYDSAMADLFSLSLNAYQNNAQIEAAIAETGLDGRSQGKVMQTIKGQSERQETAKKEAYQQKVWDVRGHKEALYITTKNEVEQARTNLSNSLVGGTQAFMQVLSSAATGAAIGAATAGIGSAVGGALGGTATSTLAGANVATPVAVDAISSAAPTITTTAGAGAGTMSTALTTTAGAGAVGSLTNTASTASTVSSSAKSLGSSFVGRFNTLYDQYEPWLKFYDKIGQMGSLFENNYKRGGYFY